MSGKLCPFKAAYAYPRCDGKDCMLYICGKCAIAVIAENFMDEIDIEKDGANNVDY